MDSYDVLVIILSIAFAISLIVWIVVGVLIVQVLKRVKAASETAQQAVENIEGFTEQLKNVGRMSTLGNLASQIVKIFKRKDK